jgi:hypothetical protein
VRPLCAQTSHLRALSLQPLDESKVINLSCSFFPHNGGGFRIIWMEIRNNLTLTSQDKDVPPQFQVGQRLTRFNWHLACPSSE